MLVGWKGKSGLELGRTVDVGRLQLAPVSAEDCQEETGRSSSSRDGQEEEAGGCPKLCSPLKLTSCVDSKSSNSNSTLTSSTAAMAMTCGFGEVSKKNRRGRRAKVVRLAISIEGDETDRWWCKVMRMEPVTQEEGDERH